MQIVSLHWMMQNISILVVGKPKASQTLKTYDLHNPVQTENLQFNPYIYTIYILSIKYAIQSYTQTRLLPFSNYLFLFVTWMLEQPARNSCTQRNGNTLITSL